MMHYPEMLLGGYLRLGTSAPKVAILGMASFVLLVLSVISPMATLQADEPAVWHTQFDRGVQAANEGELPLLLLFHDGQSEAIANDLRATLETNEALTTALDQFVLAEVDLNEQVTIDSQSCRLIEAPAFQFMYGCAGLAILDCSGTESPLTTEAISQFALRGEDRLNELELQTILELPSGTLTQRTLLFAIRVHEDEPASTSGELAPLLIGYAARHAALQASWCRQGHHYWNRRFYEINDQLPDGLVAYEVCAESWPGDELVTAAHECVESWRSSPGHWRLVEGEHPMFGYDMQRGRNGVWYAAGVFGSQHGR